ncbi:MAG: pyridoxal phosphate-dependent aminotransferase [Solirubrobacteraceae bacterium]
MSNSLINPALRLKEINEYYFSKKMKEVASLQKQGMDIINLGIGSPDIAPPIEVIEALREAALENKNGYQSYVGIDELRQEMANFYHNKFEVKLDYTKEVLPLMGSKEGIMHISMAFLNKGDTVLIPNPGYPTYTSVSNLVEANIVYYDLTEENNWLPEINQLNSFLVKKPKLFWLNYPHMPTGQEIPLNKIEEIVLWAKENNVLLVNDNPYSFILNNQKPFSIFAIEESKDIALELNSLSKTFNIAGWRVGMLLGNEFLLQQVLKVKSNMDSGMFYALQKAAIKAMQLSDDWYLQLNEEYKKRREIIWEICDILNLKYNKKAVGLFVWAKLPVNTNAEVFIYNLLHQKGIFITPGKIFGSNGEKYVRFSLCAPVVKINEAKERIVVK